MEARAVLKWTARVFFYDIEMAGHIGLTQKAHIT